jgi:hypothetical protein
MTKSKLITGIALLLASFSFAAYACNCTTCGKHVHHKKHSTAACKNHCANSKNKDCVAHCNGK